MKMQRIIYSALAAAVLSPSFGARAAPPSAEAAPAAELQPVEIEARAIPPVRFDVTTACPEIEGDLQRMVGPAWGKVGRAGSMRVQFRVEDQRVTDVSAVGNSSDYGPYIRRAVKKLACRAGSSPTQDFRFLLVIRDPEDAAAPDRVALLSAE